MPTAHSHSVTAGDRFSQLNTTHLFPDSGTSFQSPSSTDEERLPFLWSVSEHGPGLEPGLGHELPSAAALVLPSDDPQQTTLGLLLVEIPPACSNYPALQHGAP